jgi:hypothetical protein
MVVGHAVGDDRDLAAIEEPLAKTVVLLDSLKCLGPATGTAEGADAISEQDAPEPPDDLAVIVTAVDDVA